MERLKIDIKNERTKWVEIKKWNGKATRNAWTLMTGI